MKERHLEEEKWAGCVGGRKAEEVRLGRQCNNKKRDGLEMERVTFGAFGRSEVELCSDTSGFRQPVSGTTRRATDTITTPHSAYI
ncbi:hypothetical protein SLEP1_g46486 [Rubroshorea leprosula]|uniref:Uncharacterized protein n=1 Tax=Rubroshorea leprosula TaxID=152421 RepID=A0AAV5LMF3_9ROSI|nr:hypothetical protein SLEP1_g46486 [Rubroshorea leprosula]